MKVQYYQTVDRESYFRDLGTRTLFAMKAFFDPNPIRRQKLIHLIEEPFAEASSGPGRAFPRFEEMVPNEEVREKLEKNFSILRGALTKITGPVPQNESREARRAGLEIVRILETLR